MNRQRLNINPQILKWLKKEFQLQDSDMAKKMGIKKIENYLKIERGSTTPTLPQVRRLSKSLKIPLMVFYLKRQPDGKELPIDYRSRSDASLSIQSIIAIRRSYLIQDFMSKFTNGRHPELQNIQNTKPVEASQAIRRLFEYSPRGIKNPDQLFTYLREKIESLGIITLVFSIDKDDFRGFSLTGKLPVIVVASSDSKSGQIFTLLHELFHVINHQSGLCEPLSAVGLSSIEARCNQFAANFLITPNELKTALSDNNSKDDDNLRRIADQYKTSREVVLIKMIEQGLATQKEYEQKITVWHQEYMNMKKQTFVPQANPIKKVWRENGLTVTQKIIDQLGSEDITQSEAAHYLNMKASYVDFIGEQQMSRV